MTTPTTSYWDLIEPAFDAVNIYDGPAVYDQQVAAYPAPVRHLLAAHWCQSEICNCGHWQFFVISTGVLAPDALAGFRALGLADLAAIVEQAMSRLPTPDPRDTLARRKRPFKRRGLFGPRTVKRRIFDDLDDRFFEALGDSTPNRFEAAADAYAQQHQ